LGIIESTLCVLSYIKIQIFPYKNPKSFQDWVSNQFGERLFNIFFKTYTEKVWGMNCNEISSDWAAQRIKGLSLFSAVYSALTANLKRKKSSPVIKSLIDSFKYPRKGPGMMWETCAEKILAMGGTISMGSHVTGLEFNEKDHLWTVHFTKNGISELLLARNVISSAPLKELIHGLKPKVSHKTNQSSEKLRYRDFLTVAIIVKDRNIFDDNWIYIHDPSVKVGRIQNFKSWSPELVPHPGQNCYGLEYFCFEHDHLWDMADSDLISLGKKELLYLGLIQEDDVLDGHVVRQKKAYPVYDDDYSFHVDQIKNELTEKYPGLHLVGRNGMHKYNNQDHAMMTAMLTVKNIVNGRQIYDVWNVNQDAEYHEVSSSTSGLRQVPEKIRSSQANV
jgi:protoporphyrinogen oxidase